MKDYHKAIVGREKKLNHKPSKSVMKKFPGPKIPKKVNPNAQRGEEVQVEIMSPLRIDVKKNRLNL